MATDRREPSSVAVEAVAAIINRTRGESLPVDDDDRSEAREALVASGYPAAVTRLREALRPFAEIADRMEGFRGESPLWAVIDECRAARAVLNPQEADHDG